MKMLVIGGAGFIGSHVVDALIEKGNEVVIIDNLSSGKTENINEKARFYNFDITDLRLGEVFEKEKVEYVFHLAAQVSVRKSFENPHEDAKINILGSLNILNNCVKHGVRKIIFSSTGGAIYGDNVKIPTPESEIENPLSPYGIAKLSVEKYLKFYKNIYGLDYAALRYSNVYGPRQNSKGEAGVVSIFINKILNSETPVINGSGENTRDYIFVKDVASANVLVIGLSGVFNVSTGKETSINELFNKIVGIMDMKGKVREEHAPEIKGEQKRSCLDSGKLMKEGWRAEHGLDEGLRETVEWYMREYQKLLTRKI